MVLLITFQNPKVENNGIALKGCYETIIFLQHVKGKKQHRQK